VNILDRRGTFAAGFDALGTINRQALERLLPPV